MIAEDGGTGMTTPVTWSLEQLSALEPATGPSHRTFVPIIRNITGDNSLGATTDPSTPGSPH